MVALTPASPPACHRHCPFVTPISSLPALVAVRLGTRHTPFGRLRTYGSLQLGNEDSVPVTFLRVLAAGALLGAGAALAWIGGAMVWISWQRHRV